MRSKHACDTPPPTFIGRARREQLIEATIAVVAEQGYTGASLAKVAKHASVSKSVVLYHFRNKNELVEATVRQIYEEIWNFVRPYFDAQTSARGQLAAFIESEFAYMQDHRDRLLTLSYLLLNHRDSTGTLSLMYRGESELMAALSGVLEYGQANGEFRAFAIQPMATTLTHAINGALRQWLSDPGLNLTEYARELVTLFELATCKST